MQFLTGSGELAVWGEHRQARRRWFCRLTSSNFCCVEVIDWPVMPPSNFYGTVWRLRRVYLFSVILIDRPI